MTVLRQNWRKDVMLEIGAVCVCVFALVLVVAMVWVLWKQDERGKE